MRRSAWFRTAVGVVALSAVLAGCSLGDDDNKNSGTGPVPSNTGTRSGKVKIAFSSPGADHGWLAALTAGAKAEAAKYSDVEFIITEGTNDSNAQVAQVESLILQKPDVIVILPHEGAALTPVALRAMAAGIPVVNVDREFSSPAAYRLWIGGDNYGIGQAAGEYIATQLKCTGNVVEIQGIAGISVTDLRTKGFADAIKRCDGKLKIVAQQPADFVPDKGLTVMENILQAQKKIDAVYTHDDDMAEGVVSAIENANRASEMFVTGAGGSKTAMGRIENGTLYRATFLYNPIMAASAVRLARLIALGAGLSELLEKEVPSRIQLPASTVTKESVARFKDLGY